MQKVFFATPAYDGNCHVFMVSSLIAEQTLLREAGIDSHWEPYAGCCYLPVARNILVDRFLKSDCTDMIFVDADIQWEPGATMKLLKHDVNFIAGLYPYKTPEIGFPCRMDKSKVDPKTGLIEFEGVPTGFLRLTRDVFTRMNANFINMKVVDQRDNSEYICYFDTAKLGTTWWGEDLHFCNLWRNIGGRIWVEPNITFHHHGMAGFRGNFLEYVDVMGKEKAAVNE